MSTAQYLRDLLRPLGVYDLEAAFNGGELDAQGDGQHSDEVSHLGRLHSLPPQAADTPLVGYADHLLTPGW